jgi:hypothetical protein
VTVRLEELLAAATQGEWKAEDGSSYLAGRGWWEVHAASTAIGALLRNDEKDEYHFCSWACLTAFASRHLAIIEGRA